MNLVKLSNNFLVNPECINYVEQKKTRGRVTVVVCVNGKEYDLEVRFNDFLKDLQSIAEKRQFFAG